MTALTPPLLTWDDSLALGDENIDRQHKGLVDLINQMHASLDAADKEQQVMHCITSMYLYAKDHFWDEEAFMARVNYPEREEHAALHRAFVQKTHELTDCCLTDAFPYAELLDYLVHWFKEHVTVEDAKLVAYAKTRQTS